MTLKKPLFQEAGVTGFLIITLVLAAFWAPGFYAPGNLRTLLLDTPLTLTVALGMTCVMICRQIDLSVGSSMAVSGMAAGMLLRAHPGMPLAAAFLAGAGVGVLLGGLNGLLVAGAGVPSIIATLGTLSIYRGLVFLMSNGVQINANDLPERLVQLSLASRYGLSWLGVFALVFLALLHLFLTRFRGGRTLYAVGGNPEAARLAGIRVERWIAFSFLLSGLLSGIAGVMYASRFSIVNPGETGKGFELSVIAATVIGGTQISGGYGTAAGTALGCVLMSVIANLLTVAKLSGRWQLAAYGAIILAGISSQVLMARVGKQQRS